MKINTKKIKETILSFVVIIAICALIGATFGIIISNKLGSELTTMQLILRLLEIMLIFVFVMFVQVIIHEIGHLIAGLMRGYRFLSFMILNLMITRRDGKFHFSRFGIPGAGGQCLMVPPAEGDTDAGIALYNAGGIIINTFTAIITGVMLALFYDSMSFETVSILWAMTAIGVMFALQNGIPMTMGGLPNDGKNIRELKKDRFSTFVFLKTMRVVATMQEGGDIDREMPKYLCDDRDIDLKNPIHAMALNFDLSAAVSRMDFKKACAIIDRAMENADKLVGIYRYEFKMEQVFMAAVCKEYAHDVDGLLDDDLRNYMKKMSCARPDVLRMQYGIARMYERDEKKAGDIYERFIKMCKNFHSLSDVRYQTQIIEKVRQMPLQ